MALTRPPKLVFRVFKPGLGLLVKSPFAGSGVSTVRMVFTIERAL